MSVKGEVAPRGADLLSSPEAAAELGPSFTARMVKWYIETGRLTPVRIGQRTFVRRSDLARMVAEAEGAPPYRRG